MASIYSIPLFSYIDNVWNDWRSAIEPNGWIPSARKNIIYIVKNTEECGGVETRMQTYADELRRNNCNVLFVTEVNHCSRIKEKYPCCHLNFHARNFERSLIKLIDRFRIDTLEFQIKHRKYLYRLRIEELKKHCRVGCVVHGNISSLDLHSLNRMDYRIFISDRLCSIDYRQLNHYRVLPNAIRFDTPFWHYRKQRKALIVSRISREKLLQICAAIEFCRTRNISFQIAGSHQNGKIGRFLRKKYRLTENMFIEGPINTVEYLKTHVGDYLFVAGVGQVILEAGVLGYPCLLASDLGADCSTFLTRENIGNFGRNFTFAYPSAEMKKWLVTTFDPEHLAEYDISGAIGMYFDIRDRFREYFVYICQEE